MVDLFSVGKTPLERYLDLKEELVVAANRDGSKIKSNKVKIYIGDHDTEGNPLNINNNILIVSEPYFTKPFETSDDKKLYKLLSEFDITNFFYTYYFWYKKNTNVSLKDIKQNGHWIKRLVDILEPKLIICMGEKAQFSFLKKKAMLRDYHGKQIGEIDEIPIYTTYPISYYVERSEFEDRSFKNFIKTKDWTSIQAKYKELIND
jgi:hypothetical protein